MEIGKTTIALLKLILNSDIPGKTQQPWKITNKINGGK